VLAREHPPELELADRPVARLQLLPRLDEAGVVVLLAAELVQRARVVELRLRLVERLDQLLELGLLLNDDLSLLRVVPEAGVRRLRLQLLEPLYAAFVVKDASAARPIARTSA
jgi:hypothetical protein